MTRRAALYARFSTDLQNPASTADQLRECRALAARLGAEVVAEFTDEAISGASRVKRPGLTALMAAAGRGAFDLVIAEALDRLARSGGDTWDVYDELQDAGVRIVTIAEPVVDRMVIGFKGTMNEIDLENTGRRVRRGLTGVVQAGRHPAKPPYGYRRKLVYDAQGEPIRGLLEIDPVGAEIIRRACREFVAGSSGRAIAARFNAEAIPSPAGGLWHSNALMGDARRLQGVFRNPIYAGELVWNRATHRKSRRTGMTKTRANAAADYVRQPAPDLRIVDGSTWAAVQVRLDAVSAEVKAKGNASAGNMPRRLFSGLLRCGLCGSVLATAGPGNRYRCRARTDKGPTACANGRTAVADDLEAEVLEQLRRDLLHPEVVEHMVRRYHEIQSQKGRAHRDRRAGLERELGEVRRKADRLVDQVAAGELAGRTVAGKIAELEARQTGIEAELAKLQASAEVVTIHPQAAGKYRKLVEELQARLVADAHAKGSAEREAARAALRQVIRSVKFFPGERRGQWTVAIDGDLTALFEKAAAEAPAKRASRA